MANQNPETQAYTQQIENSYQKQHFGECQEKFGSYDALINYYLTLYRDLQFEENVAFKDYYDKEFNGIDGSCENKKIRKFSVSRFLEMSDQFSEGAATFLKSRDDKDLGLYIENLWKR